MKIVKLADHLAVSEQILQQDIPEIVAQGYKVLINNRPDNEAEGQPISDDIKTAALAAGLEYHYLPVTAGDFPGAAASEMAALLHHQDKPVLAFCRTGTRCTNLWVATASPEAREGLRRQAQALGYDLAMSDAAC